MLVVRVVLVPAFSKAATILPSRPTTPCGTSQVTQLRRRHSEVSLCTHVSDFTPSSPPNPKSPLAVFAIIVLVVLVAGITYVALYRRGYSLLAGRFSTWRSHAVGIWCRCVEFVQTSVRRGSDQEAERNTAPGTSDTASPRPRTHIPLLSFPAATHSSWRRYSRILSRTPSSDGSTQNLLRAHDRWGRSSWSGESRSSVDWQERWSPSPDGTSPRGRFGQEEV